MEGTSQRELIMAELLARLRQRDAEAQQEAWQRWHPKLRALCLRLLRDPVWAEEVAADLWMDFVYDAVGRIESERALDSYLRMMTVRRCVRLRDKRRKQDDLDHQPELPASAEDPRDAVAAALDAPAERTRLADCLERLRKKARDIVRMRFHLDMTQEAIGLALGVSKQYAGRVIAKSLEALRLCMEEAPA